MKFINGIHLNIDKSGFSNTGTNSKFWDNMRRATQEEEATMELSDRRLFHFTMSSWKQDESSWDNLFKVRGDKTGTMNITGQVVNNIKQLIK